MLISELIAQLEALKKEHGDLPVMLQNDDEYEGHHYWKVEKVDAKINEYVGSDDENDEDGYLNFIALDYM